MSSICTEREHEADSLRILFSCHGRGVRDECRGPDIGRCRTAAEQGRRPARAGGLRFRSWCRAEQRHTSRTEDDGGPDCCCRAGGRGRCMDQWRLRDTGHVANHRASRGPLAGWARDELRDRRTRRARRAIRLRCLESGARDGDRGAHGAAEHDEHGHLLQRTIRHRGERRSDHHRRRPDDRRQSEFLQPANDDLPSSDERDQDGRTDVVCAVVSHDRCASHRRDAGSRWPSG